MLVDLSQIINRVDSLQSKMFDLQETIRQMRGIGKNDDWQANLMRDDRHSVKVLYSEYTKLKFDYDTIMALEVKLSIEQLKGVDLGEVKYKIEENEEIF